MSQNRPDNETTDATGGDIGTPPSATGDPSQWGIKSDTPTGITTGGTVSTGGGTGAATGLAAKAKEYGQTVAEYGQQAKEYISDKAGVVGEKIQDLRNKDYAQMAEDAKQYARQNPGQALLVAAAAGFVLGLLLRGGRR